MCENCGTPDGLENSQTGMEVREKATVAQINEAMSKAAGIPQKKELTPAQKRRQQIAEENYWKGMISRREAYDMVKAVESDMLGKMRLMFVEVRTLTQLILDKGLATREQLDHLGEPIMVSIFGKEAVEQMKGKKEETKIPQVDDNAHDRPKE